MLLNDLNNVDPLAKYKKLKEHLVREFDVDVSIYEGFDISDLKGFLRDLDNKKNQIMIESEYGTHVNNQEYVKTVLLREAVRIILKEIRPKRVSKKQGVHETMDYKVHLPSGASVDHNVDDNEERPDLYWRKHQWEQERSMDNYPVEIADAPPAGEAYIDAGGTMEPYAQNVQPDTSATPENDQEVGVYVAVMNPNRFLGDGEAQQMLHIEPVIKTGNDTSLLSRKVKPRFVDVDEIETYKNEFETEEKNMTDKMVEELGEMLDTSILEEGELQRAEMVFATNDVIMRLTKMIEDLSKIATEDVLGLVDGVRLNFGPNEAEKFSQLCEQGVQISADGIQNFKEGLEAYREKFEARISDEDSQTPLQIQARGEDLDLVPTDQQQNVPNPDMAQGNNVAGPEMGGEQSLDDVLGGDEGGAEEPLGRAKKESKVVNINGKRVRLSEDQFLTLWKARVLTETIRRRIVEYSTDGYGELLRGAMIDRDKADNEIQYFDKYNGLGGEKLSQRQYEALRYLVLVAKGTDDHYVGKEFAMAHAISLDDPEGYKLRQVMLKLARLAGNEDTYRRALENPAGLPMNLAQKLAKSMGKTESVVITIDNKRVRVSEEQLKALIFAKNFRKIVESKGANVVRLSESQAKKIQIAKKLTEKIANIIETEKKEKDLDEKCGKMHAKKKTKTENLDEEKPSSGLPAKKKSAIVKKAKASGADDPAAVSEALIRKNVKR